ncbi:hypothetical protein ACFL6C_12160, partial [Myxococcota bacterium]
MPRVKRVSLISACALVIGCGEDPPPSYTYEYDPDSQPIPVCSPLEESCECGRQPSPAVCEQELPAPTTSEEIEGFIRGNLVHVECDEEQTTRWELDYLQEAVTGSNVIIFGEVHGSHEIGVASAAVFAQLAEEGIVNHLALELGVDLSDALQEYVSTGHSMMLNQYGFDYWSPDFYGRKLPETARSLHEQGVSISIGGVDSPWRPSYANEQIEQIAASMT